jgi:peptidyl-Lys metalloendopeptidase
VCIRFGTVYLCGSFWGAPVRGSDSKGGTLVHETSHFNKIAKTEDVAYGTVDSKKLAKESPKEAIGNADSHEYFAENDPSLA